MSFDAYGFPTRKAAGEWVESVFTVKAMALGLGVSKPLGDSQPYDFLVTRRNLPPARVQVKSAFAKRPGDCYLVSMLQHRAPYDSADLDFFVVYIPPEDAWYVIPVRAVKVPAMSVRPRLFRGPYEKYRGAWDLLTGDPADNNRSLGFTIHAAADPRV